MIKTLVVIITCSLLLTSCGGAEVCDIEYSISMVSVIVAAIFLETLIVPLYIIGFDIFRPVGKKPIIKGTSSPTVCS